MLLLSLLQAWADNCNFAHSGMSGRLPAQGLVVGLPLRQQDACRKAATPAPPVVKATCGAHQTWMLLAAGSGENLYAESGGMSAEPCAAAVEDW